METVKRANEPEKNTKGLFKKKIQKILQILLSFGTKVSIHVPVEPISSTLIQTLS